MQTATEVIHTALIHAIMPHSVDNMPIVTRAHILHSPNNNTAYTAACYDVALDNMHPLSRSFTEE